MNDLISRSAAKDEILSWAVCLQKPHLLSKDDTMHILDTLPAVDAVEVGSCDGCYWKEIGRQQKCSCCRRNRHMKDNYERRAVK